MTYFVDTAGRKWRIEISVPAAAQLRSEGIDLMNVADIERMFSDPSTCLHAIHTLVQRQRKTRHVGPDEMARIINAGNVAEQAIAALAQEVDRFCELHANIVKREVTRVVTGAIA